MFIERTKGFESHEFVLVGGKTFFYSVVDRHFIFHAPQLQRTQRNYDVIWKGMDSYLL